MTVGVDARATHHVSSRRERLPLSFASSNRAKIVLWPPVNTPRAPRRASARRTTSIQACSAGMDTRILANDSNRFPQ